MLKRHEVQVLLKAGHGPTEVSRLEGVSLASVKRIVITTCCPPCGMSGSDNSIAIGSGSFSPISWRRT